MIHAKIGYLPSIQKIAEDLGYNTHDIDKIAKYIELYVEPIVSLDDNEEIQVRRNGEIEMISRNRQEEEIVIDNSLEYKTFGFDTQEEMVDYITVFLAKQENLLTATQINVIRLSFGIGKNRLSRDEIATYLDLSRERVRQIYDKAIKRIRQNYKIFDESLDRAIKKHGQVRKDNIQKGETTMLGEIKKTSDSSVEKTGKTQLLDKESNEIIIEIKGKINIQNFIQLSGDYSWKDNSSMIFVDDKSHHLSLYNFSLKYSEYFNINPTHAVSIKSRIKVLAKVYGLDESAVKDMFYKDAIRNIEDAVASVNSQDPNFILSEKVHYPYAELYERLGMPQDSEFVEEKIKKLIASRKKSKN